MESVYKNKNLIQMDYNYWEQRFEPIFGFQYMSEFFDPDWELFEQVNKLKEEWRKLLHTSLPNNDTSWLEVFPEAKSVIPDKIREWRVVIDQANPLIKKALNIIKEKSAEGNRWFWRGVLKHTFEPVHDVAIARRHIRRLQWMLPRLTPNNKIRWNDALAKARGSNLVAVAENHGIKLKKTGNSYISLCPVHNDHRPSFHIYPSSQKFFCFACQAKGDSISLVQIITGCSFKDAVYKLQN